MDAVEILLFCVVGFSVLVFLILDNLEESRKSCHEADQSSVVHDSETKTVKEIMGSDCESEKQIITQNIGNPVFEEIKEEEEEEEEEEEVNASSEKSDLCSGLLGISGKSEGNMGISEGEEENLDDWEGIERSELEKRFGESVVFLSYKSNADKIDEDLKLELYGLQKVALEGTCHGSQPMAFNIFARSKWDAWQKLGNMSREMAMEKYVDILSKAIPGWKSGEGKEAIKDATSSED